EEAPSAQEQSDDNFSGKYTIQLSSFQSLAEAKQFAEGFKVLGYNPIINEKNIPGRGNWFRVSLGVFNSLSETKDYILKHKSLFAERDYVLTKFE
ncbi:SPOR domain-containing protein, partial [Bacteriovorax sp. DB6_IX]|uniref:SPOR domain-containing protein n=1 Tax=Bacteriovorax sp. DB6_IX TaxID=1353530 RepID=UPI000389E0AB